MTSELEKGTVVIRGGSYENYGDLFPVSFRDAQEADEEPKIKNIGFRIALIIK